MKTFNIVVGTLAVALLDSLAVSFIAEQFLERNTAMLVVMPLSMALGFSSRRIVEKFFGYTLAEAMKEGSDESNGN